MKSGTLLALVFLVASVSVLQGQVGSESFIPDLHQLDCSKLYSPGCKSLNEMIAAGDKEITDAMQQKTALACFRTGEDHFFIVSFNQPSLQIFTPSPSTGFEEMHGIVNFTSFDGGTSADWKLAVGAWKKIKEQPPEEATFESRPKSRLTAQIDPSEILLSFTFTNVSNTTTLYSTKIRRSTLRFSEVYQADEKPKAPPATKGKQPTASQKPEIIQQTFSGYCAKLK